MNKKIRSAMLFAAIMFFLVSLILTAIALHDIDISQNMAGINKVSMILLKTELWSADYAADGVTSYTQAELYLMGIRTFIFGAILNIFSFFMTLLLALSNIKNR